MLMPRVLMFMILYHVVLDFQGPVLGAAPEEAPSIIEVRSLASGPGTPGDCQNF